MIVIYAIYCLENKMCYVGSTRKLAKRFREHRCLLRAGKHACKRLQSDWTEKHESRFRVLVLEHVETLDERRKAEVRWMSYFKGHDLLYNDHLISMQPTEEARIRGVANAHNEPGNRWTPEVNLRRRLAQLGIPKGHGAKISATKQARSRR
jgi:group I intron endonuclease